MASSTPAAEPITVIDSHVHLYPESELDNLAWLTPENPLWGQHSVEELRAAADPESSDSSTTPAPSRLAGFIYIEADRKNGSGRDWTGPLAEMSWVSRIATGRPRDGEGHTAADAALCLAIVPWAPVHLGPAQLEKYLAQAEEAAGEKTWSLVRGFRYLLQDKEPGTGLKDEFVAGLKLLGKKGYVFDVGVDQHRRGRAQLDECVELIDRAHEGVPEDEKVTFIINHLCKPDLGIISTADKSFVAWRTAMFTLAKCSKTYMKLSGCFSEMPEGLKRRSAEEIFEGIYPWLAVVLAAFGADRIMFGSDWPVCTLGQDDGAWEKWRKVVDRTCWMATMSDEDKALIFGGTAKAAYGIEDN